MRFFIACSIAWLAALPLCASAQWVWQDATGRKVFSDRSPPPEIPPQAILKQPGGRPRADADAPLVPPGAAASASASPVARAASGALRPTGRDPALEARKAQADAAEAEKAKAEEEKYLKARADNCRNAQRRQQTIDSGVRLSRRNDKGEIEFLDDAQRAEELRRAQEAAASDCGPPPSR